MRETDLDLLIRAARSAGEIAKTYFQSDPKSWEKSDGAGPVTEADIAVNEHLHSVLLSARPNYGWLSEETEDRPTARDQNAVFVIDPIDGTRSFIAGSDMWAHSLAVVRDGVVTAGAVYLPMRDVVYAATHGGGATRNGASIQASDRDQLAGADALTTATMMQDIHWPAGAPDVNRHYRPSLAYRLALIAEGRFDAMWTFRPTWEWDIAAGSLIAAEAGAIVTDMNGDPISFNASNPQANGLICAGARLMPSILELRKKTGDQRPPVLR